MSALPPPTGPGAPARRPLPWPVLLAVGLALVWLAVSGLQPPAPTEAPERPGASVPVGAAEFDLPRMTADIAAKLVLVLALAYGTLALLRRYGSGLGWDPHAREIRIVESSALGANRSLYLVQVADRRFLLGVTASQITPLAQWDAEASPTQSAALACPCGRGRLRTTGRGSPPRRTLGSRTHARRSAGPRPSTTAEVGTDVPANGSPFA